MDPPVPLLTRGRNEVHNNPGFAERDLRRAVRLPCLGQRDQCGRSGLGVWRFESHKTLDFLSF